MKDRIIEIVELGQPQSLIQRESSPVTELIKADSLIEELNEQLRKHAVGDLGAVRRSCSNCKFFESFRDAYYDDMEPDYEGFCRNGESPRFGNEGANSGYVCDFHNYV